MYNFCSSMYKVLFVEPEENFKKILFFSNEFNIRRKYPIFLFAATWLAISTKYEIGSHVCFSKSKKRSRGRKEVTKNCNFSQIRFSRIASNFKLGNGFWTYYEEEERKMFFALYKKSHMYSVSKWGFTKKRIEYCLFENGSEKSIITYFSFCSKMQCMFPYWPPKLHLQKFSVSQENVSILPYI